MKKRIKPKTCKVCKGKYTPFQTTQQVCGPICAIKHSQAAKDKAFKKETKRLKDKAKTRAKWLEEAQTAFNAYIRQRDINEPCISCGTTKQNIQYCAGHYFTRGGHPELRFSELNVHKQCNKNCNLMLSGNIAAYRVNLLAKIGIEALTWLEGQHRAQKWSIDDIKEIKQYYKDQFKELSKC